MMTFMIVTYSQCNLLHTLYHYIDVVVYSRYIIYCTIFIARLMSKNQKYPRRVFNNQ